MTTRPPRERFLIEVEDDGDVVPVIIRLRRFLKRAYGLRCRWARAARPGETIEGIDENDTTEDTTP